MLSRPVLSVIAIAAVILAAIGGCRENHDPVDGPTVTQVWSEPSRPSAGDLVSFHARIINESQQQIPMGSKFCLAIGVDGQPMGTVAYSSPQLDPGGALDVSTHHGTGNSVDWHATGGRHFVVAGIAAPSDHFDDTDVVMDTLGSSMVAVGTDNRYGPIRIMPLGDSITGGSKCSTSYRYYLSKSLHAAGYNDLTFVGSLHGVTSDNPPPDTDWDENHEGHPGWRADEIENGSDAHRDWAASKLSGQGGWARVYRPDIVVIDLGLNDLSQGRTPRIAVASISRIIETLRRANSRVGIVLAEVTPEWNQENGYNLISELNSRLRILALQRTTLQSPITTVDLNTGIDPGHDLVDGVHPNDACHQQLASRLYPVVKTLVDRAIAEREHPSAKLAESTESDPIP